MVSNCEIEGHKFYVVDSPLYGNALYLFCYKEGANKAAEHFQTHGTRLAAKYYPGFTRRIIHTDNWRQILAQEVFSSFLNRKVTDPNVVLGQLLYPAALSRGSHKERRLGSFCSKSE